jgi:hypothetical protein
MSETLQTYNRAREDLKQSWVRLAEEGATDDGKAEKWNEQCLEVVRQSDEQLTDDDRARIVADNPGHWEEPLSTTPPTPNPYWQMS